MLLKNIIKILLIYLTLFIMMVCINHINSNKTKYIYRYKDLITTHESTKNNQKCTWECHNNTGFCKKNHVKYLAKYFSITDPIYFKIINSLKSTGDYQGANVFILVFIIPTLSFYFIIKGIESIKNNR